MPYKGISDPDLPDRVKTMPKGDKEQWIAVFNSVYARCIDDNGDAATCEPKAFAQAYGVVKKEGSRMGKLRDIWEQFKARFETELVSADEAERASGGGDAGWTGPPQTVPRTTGREMIIRQGDGKVRWLNVSATAVLNRVGEFDSRALFDNFIRRAGNDLSSVKRDFYHLGEFSPDFILGDVDGLWRDDAVLISTGTYRDTPLAQAIVRAITKDPTAWGDSIAYLPVGEPETTDVNGTPISVYRDGVLQFIATLPEARAASELTATLIQEAPMKADILKALEGLELDETIRKRFADLVDTINGEAAGLKTRAAPAPDGNLILIPEPTVITAAPAPVVLDEALVGEIVRQMSTSEIMDSLKAAIATLQEAVLALSGGAETAAAEVQVENAKTERALTAIAERLAALERTDEDKRRDYVADLPATPAVRATFRPRVERAAPDDRPEPANVQAARIIKEKEQATRAK